MFYSVRPIGINRVGAVRRKGQYEAFVSLPLTNDELGILFLLNDGGRKLIRHRVIDEDCECERKED